MKSINLYLTEAIITREITASDLDRGNVLLSDIILYVKTKSKFKEIINTTIDDIDIEFYQLENSQTHIEAILKLFPIVYKYFDVLNVSSIDIGFSYLTKRSWITIVNPKYSSDWYLEFTNTNNKITFRLNSRNYHSIGQYGEETPYNDSLELEIKEIILNNKK